MLKLTRIVASSCFLEKKFLSRFINNNQDWDDEKAQGEGGRDREAGKTELGSGRASQVSMRLKPYMARFSTNQQSHHRCPHTNLKQLLAQGKDDCISAVAIADDDDNEDTTVTPMGPMPFLDDAQSCCDNASRRDEDGDANNHHQSETR